MVITCKKKKKNIRNKQHEKSGNLRIQNGRDRAKTQNTVTHNINQNTGLPMKNIITNYIHYLVLFSA